MQAHRSSIQSGMSALFKEPLLHFMLLASVLFLVQALWGKDERELVLVDLETRSYLIEQHQELLSRPISEDEKQQLIDAYIEEELLVRESRKLGYDNTSRVRKLLAQNMRFFFSSDQSDPGEEQLRAYYNANSRNFIRPQTVTYDHVILKDKSLLAEGLLERLNAGEKHHELGEFTTYDRPVLYGLEEREVAEIFGARNTAKIMAIDDREWHGPFTTVRGTHFLRVSERFASVQASFEEVKNFLPQQWELEENRKVLDREMSKIRTGYRIEIMQGEVPGEAPR